jgi:hypothetical protein
METILSGNPQGQNSNAPLPSCAGQGRALPKTIPASNPTTFLRCIRNSRTRSPRHPAPSPRRPQPAAQIRRWLSSLRRTLSRLGVANQSSLHTLQDLSPIPQASLLGVLPTSTATFTSTTTTTIKDLRLFCSPYSLASSSAPHSYYPARIFLPHWNT